MGNLVAIVGRPNAKAAVVNSLMDKIAAKCRTKPKKIEDSKPKGRSVDSLYERLNLLKN